MAVIRETGLWNKFMPRKSIVTPCIWAGNKIVCEGMMLMFGGAGISE
jgi:hypothetical protein